MKNMLTRLYKLLTLDFLFYDARRKRRQFVSSITLPRCTQAQDQMKYTDKRPYYAGVLEQYITWNEWLDLLVKYGWVIRIEKYDAYYIGNIDSLLRSLYEDTKTGKLKLDESLMVYKCNIDFKD